MTNVSNVYREAINVAPEKVFSFVSDLTRHPEWSGGELRIESLTPEPAVVGIHYGEAVLGWIGTEKRLEFTSLGDSVNTTKRIQENSAKNQNLICREAYEGVKDEVDARPFAPLIVNGKTQPLDVFDVVGIK